MGYRNKLTITAIALVISAGSWFGLSNMQMPKSGKSKPKTEFAALTEYVDDNAGGKSDADISKEIIPEKEIDIIVDTVRYNGEVKDDIREAVKTISDDTSTKLELYKSLDYLIRNAKTKELTNLARDAKKDFTSDIQTTFVYINQQI